MKYLVILIFLSSCAFINNSDLTKVDIVAFGEVKATPPIGRFLEKNSHNGYVNVMHENESPVFIEKEKIIAKKGKRFGINVTVSGGEFGDIANLITRVTHPAFSDGQMVDQWDSPMNYGVSRFTGWIFELDKELVAGDWKFEILDKKGKVLAFKKFEVSIEE